MFQKTPTQPGKPVQIWNPQILLIIGTFFTFLPMSVFYAINLYRLGQAEKIKTLGLYILSGVLLIVGLIFAGSFFSGHMPLLSRIFGIVLNFAITYLLYMQQKEEYVEHSAKCGQEASIFIPLIFAILFLFTFQIVLLFLIAG